MTQTVDEFDFGQVQGAAVAEEASGKGGDFQREIMWLSLKADPASKQQGKDRAIVRLVTEYERKPWMDGFGNNKYNFAWITVPQHYAQTKQKPPYASEKMTWPTKWSSVCRKGPVFNAKYNGDCYNCQQGNKPGDRTWALGIEREAVIENGQILGYRDKTREVFDHDAEGNPIVERIEPDGTPEGKKIYKMKIVPAYLVMNFGWKNFFNALNGQASYRGTVLDRDYVITRTGTEGNDTNYTFVGLDPIILPENNEYGLPAGTKYDLGLIIANEEGTNRPIPLMEGLYPDLPDLRKIVAERTTDDYYGRWFVPGWLPKDFDPSKVPGGQQQATGGYQPIGGQQGGQQGYVPPAAQQTQPQPPAAAPPAPAPAAPAEPSQNVLANLKSRVLAGQQGEQPAAQ